MTGNQRISEEMEALIEDCIAALRVLKNPKASDAIRKSSAGLLVDSLPRIVGVEFPSPAAMLGAMTSAAKAVASRRNGAKGGRPRKVD
jgi:hypothetical protein